MIALHRINFAGYSSIDICPIGLIVDCAFDSDNGEVSSFLNRDAIATDSYRGDIRRIHHFKYSEFFTPKFTFIKKDFSDFTADEYRRLVSWLTSKPSTSLLTAYRDDSDVIEFEVIGNFGEIQPYKIANHRTVGVTAVFESVAPWALSPVKKFTTTIDNPTVMHITCNTDDWASPVYPKITIKQSSDIVVNVTQEMASKIFTNNDYIDGTVYHYNGKYYWKTTDGVEHEDTSNSSGLYTTSVLLYNDTYNIKTYIKGNTSNETIVIDGANKLVFTENAARNVLGNDFAWEWFPLMQGENAVRIIGNCTITFEWREPIKLGEF